MRTTFDLFWDHQFTAPAREKAFSTSKWSGAIFDERGVVAQLKNSNCTCTSMVYGLVRFGRSPFFFFEDSIKYSTFSTSTTYTRVYTLRTYLVLLRTLSHHDTKIGVLLRILLYLLTCKQILVSVLEKFLIYLQLRDTVCCYIVERIKRKLVGPTTYYTVSYNWEMLLIFSFILARLSKSQNNDFGQKYT